MDQTNLEWQTFTGSRPNGAVLIYNDYVGRIDYVSKYGSEAGFYNPEKGPHCFYPYNEKEHRDSPFEILVNKDNFEVLEWKDGSYGSVPENAIETVPGSKIYVGKNKYGLGKVDVKNKAFFLPWEGKESWYKNYQVLTFNKEVIREDISDVKYKTDGVKVIQSPPETIQTSVLTNKDCEPVKETTTLLKTTQKEERWDTSFSLTVGATTSIKTEIPFIVEGKIELKAEATFQFTNGTTRTESTTQTVSVEAYIPPNHTCRVRMVGYKYTADIPYTARLRRTYRHGETRWTSISGTCKSVQMGEVWSVVDPCEPIP
ncbi:natterin-3 [Etheostoma spectabile]|uniref:natterin-3 n=1 Tax=Etheostoma spectabile TaxID=54343 RepID=UPI0013AFE484|nr:natterin-3-like [Etheostoma spectabile]